MGKIILVKVSGLTFWLENFRFGHAESQEDALEKLKTTKHFSSLVESIRKHGFQHNNLLTVAKDTTTKEKYLVYDGNRRLAAIKQIPEIEEIPVYWEEDREALNAILDREHNSADPAGRLRWTSVQQARWERSLVDQNLRETLSSNAICLGIIEFSNGEPLTTDFPLSTFSRLYEGAEFSEMFGVNVDGTEVTDTESIRLIVSDIESREINSRKLNTTDNIATYLERVQAREAQENRTNLADDNESDEDVGEGEEEQPTRLFRPSELDKLAPFIRNHQLVKELRNASVARYPSLLFLATRAVLDTLRNIDKETNPPKALGTNDLEGYLSNNRITRQARNLIDRLGEHAHNLTRVATSTEINNNRDRVERLIDCIIHSIEHKREQ